MNIRDVVSELSRLEPAAQAKAVEAANSMRETNALLSGLGSGAKRGPKPGAKRAPKAAPVAVAPKGKGGKAKAALSVLTD